MNNLEGVIMKIALAQLDVKVGHPKQNVARMLEMIQEAKNNNVNLIAFPEMAIGGYLAGDKWTDDQYCKNLAEYDDIIREASDGIAIVYGNICLLDKPFEYKGFDGRKPRYNAVYCTENKKIATLRMKTLLPNYRVFDDKRYFLSANDKRFENDYPAILSNGVKVGLEICEDMWWEDYGINVTEKLIDAGADLIINISSSPWTPGKNIARDNRINNMKKMFGDRFVPFYYVNACGVQNNGKNIITFDGDSRVYNKNAEKLPHKLNAYEEGIIYIEDSDLNSDNWPTFGNDECSAEEIVIKEKFDAIIRAYKGIDEMLGWKPNYVFGLSGGIDSSLTSTIAVLALGKDRVFGFNLPSKYNSEKTKNAASSLATNLGIKYEVIPIEKIFYAIIDRFIIMDENVEISSLVDENIQARIRGSSILLNLAAIYKGVMTNNGNKLETALGYFTMAGDNQGVFAPIGDLTKVEVFKMAKYINKWYGEIIPSSLIPDDFNFDIAPSAELKENQLDPMKWGYHDRMLELMLEFKKHSPEDFMRWYINGELCTKMRIKESLFTKYNFDNPKVFIDDLEWFVSTIQKNVFKRVQSPPIVLLSKTAYGYDLRESMFAWESSLEYDRLKAKILGGI